MNGLAMKLNEMIDHEVRMARGWLLAVAALTFLVELVHILSLPPELQGASYKLVVLGCAQPIALFMLWIFSKKQPKPCLTLALVVFWAVQGIVMMIDPSNAFRGILFKLIFTLALLGGIRAASRAEELGKQRAEAEGS